MPVEPGGGGRRDRADPVVAAATTAGPEPADGAPRAPGVAAPEAQIPEAATREAAAPEPSTGRPRRAPARIRPESLARRAGEVREGLTWLGRPPEARAGLLYRLLVALARVVLVGCFRFRIEIEQEGPLPSGGYLVVAAAHRGWMDPFLVLFALPVEPRPWFLGSGPSTLTSRFRAAFIRRVGGLLPVWRGGVGVEQHVAAARAVLEAGGVFVQMPEGTVNGPIGRLAAFRHGASLIALRTLAPIVLVAMAGTEELYLGKRMAIRVLRPTTVAELLGATWRGAPPPPGSRTELELARRLSAAFEARLGPVVAELHRRTVDPPGRRRWSRRRLTWLFLGPGPLIHEPTAEADDSAGREAGGAEPGAFGDRSGTDEPTED